MTIAEECDVLLVGHTESHRFASVKDALQNESCRNACTLSDALTELERSSVEPDLIVVYQSYPNEYPVSQVKRIIGRLPFSRFVIAFGPWCESIGRTEQLWPGGWCVPLHLAPLQIAHELNHRLNEIPPVPPTVSRDEAFAMSVLKSASPANISRWQGMSVHITSLDRSFGELAERAFCSFGFHVRTSGNSDIELIATTYPDETTCSRVAAIRNSTRDARIIVSTDMATPEDAVQLKSAGADAVIGQLRFLDELAGYLQRHRPAELHAK